VKEWDLLEAWAFYKEGNSLVRVGERYGLTKQTVHKRFRRTGRACRNQNIWTPAEVDIVIAAYQAAGKGPIELDPLSERLGRHRSVIAKKAGQLGFTNKSRPHTPEVNAKGGVTRQLQNMMRLEPLRPALGMRHTAESLKKMSVASLRSWASPTRKPRTLTDAARQANAERARTRLMSGNMYSRAKRGRREDIGDFFFRSSWEANYARYLNLLKSKGVILGWEFEVETFWFEKIRRGVRSYMPDFKVTTTEGVYYVEVKGWMDDKSKTKLKRMAKYYPTIDLRVVAKKEYVEIERKMAGAIPGWERATDSLGVRRKAA
jgi:hypothetical protein